MLQVSRTGTREIPGKPGLLKVSIVKSMNINTRSTSILSRLRVRAVRQLPGRSTNGQYHFPRDLTRVVGSDMTAETSERAVSTS